MMESLQFIGICSVGVQRAVEAFDPLLEQAPRYKKSLAIIISIALGFIIAAALRKGFFFEGGNAADEWKYALVNGLLIGGGTETFNSLVKILGSAKQATERKALRATRTGDPHLAARQLPNPPTFAPGAVPP